jgi:hypothetical protein
MTNFERRESGMKAMKVFVEDHALCYYAGYPGGGKLQYLVLLESSQASDQLLGAKARRPLWGRKFGSAG